MNATLIGYCSPHISGGLFHPFNGFITPIYVVILSCTLFTNF